MGVRGFRGWFESQFPKSVYEIPKATSNESFDHVLVDVNALLHICLRRSRSDGHALMLFIKELDAIVQYATPLQNLVLALDGPPGAAKLATQRNRRYQTVTRAELMTKQIDQILSVEHTKLSKTRKSKDRIRKLQTKKEKIQQELKTLQLTPATDFMRRAVLAMEYWAYQRLNSRSTVLTQNDVTILISPSTASGEGEIKLLEWLNHKPRRGESVAFFGGDSDLVLEAFLVPLSSTHNVFVLLPDGNKRVLVVSIWEATRKLASLTRTNDFGSLIRVRTDFVFLLILNGNDYLPKLRSCTGFNRLYQSYIKLRRGGGGAVGYLLDPATLEINVDFAILYFLELDRTAEPLPPISRDEAVSIGITPLAIVNNFVASSLLPSPIKFLVDGGEPENANDAVDEEEEDDDTDEDEVGDMDAEEDEGFDMVPDVDLTRHQVLLGDPDSEDFMTYETWLPKYTSHKAARHTLSLMILTDMKDSESSDGEHEDDLDLTAFTAGGYDWEVKEKAPADVQRYLYGLLWNMQTYQDGVCADYGYNYGRKKAPTPGEVVAFLKQAQRDGVKLIPSYFCQQPVATPAPAGLSSLAALPSFLPDLIAEPYNKIAPEKAEEIFADCMSPIDNVFDVEKFEAQCKCELAALGIEAPSFNPDDHHWKLVTRSPKPLPRKTRPPEVFSGRVDQLRPSDRLRRSQIQASYKPRPRDPSVWATPGPFLSKIGLVENWTIGWRTEDGSRNGGCPKAKTNWPPMAQH
jgi:XRN 5'-3' exonuclease N-terminus